MYIANAFHVTSEGPVEVTMNLAVIYALQRFKADAVLPNLPSSPNGCCHLRRTCSPRGGVFQFSSLREWARR